MVLRVRILGPLGLWCDGDSVPDLSLRDATTRRLLKCLVVNRGRLLPQEVLIERCWPHSAAEAGRASLHAAISRVRRVLGGLLQRQGPGYLLAVSPDLLVDRDEYLRLMADAESRASHGDWEAVRQAVDAAEALVTGELLACEPYADWAEEARVAFRRRRSAALDLRLCALQRLGAWAEVIATARLAIDLDPLREGPYRALMGGYAALGEVALALRTYEECRSALSEALGLEPSLATRRAYQELLRSGARGDERVSAWWTWVQ